MPLLTENRLETCDPRGTHESAQGPQAPVGPWALCRGLFSFLQSWKGAGEGGEPWRRWARGQAITAARAGSRGWQVQPSPCLGCWAVARSSPVVQPWEEAVASQPQGAWLLINKNTEMRAVLTAGNRLGIACPDWFHPQPFGPSPRQSGGLCTLEQGFEKRKGAPEVLVLIP